MPTTLSRSSSLMSSSITSSLMEMCCDAGCLEALLHDLSSSSLVMDNWPRDLSSLIFWRVLQFWLCLLRHLEDSPGTRLLSFGSVPLTRGWLPWPFTGVSWSLFGQPILPAPCVWPCSRLSVWCAISLQAGNPMCRTLGHEIFDAFSVNAADCWQVMICTH